MSSKELNESDDSDWCANAPKLVDRPKIWLTSATAVLLFLSPWPALLGLRYGTWVTFLFPLAMVIAVMVWSEHVGDRMRAAYVRQLIDEAGLDPEDDDATRRASKAYKDKNEISNTQGFMSVFFILYLFVCYGFIVFKGNDFDFLSLRGWLDVGADLLWMLVASFASIVYGIVFVGTVSPFEFSLSDLRPATPVLASIPASDRNDIDIAGLSVVLQALMRRAETYTIESTLLSALSFSAFVGIAFSDQGPIENSSWMQQINQADSCDGLRWSVISDCAASVFQIVPDHIMYIVSGTLLLTSVFFISTLVIRFRFNEAYKYTEEILSIAQILNEKENSARGVAKRQLTDEISRLLEKSHSGLDDLRPLGTSMKNFRNIGIGFFVTSVSLCGLYFHWSVSLLLLGVVVVAYIVTYLDSFRRHSRFLPGLESVAMSIWHKKRM
ncbi:hypothetical protein [Brevundimonas sp.]|uniref:hypothetical protein n=1 Tax=Brevundimonas sp. TaxID=1871086 RepID=UPI002FCACD7C